MNAAFNTPGRVPGIAACSVLRLGATPQVRLHFHGRDRLPPGGTAGYVRSRARAVIAATTAPAETPLPWRDYPQEMLTGVHTLLAVSSDHVGQVLISARNTLNEFGYQTRIAGRWWRRIGDRAVPPQWPVLTIADGILGFRAFGIAEQSAADILTGIPLVIAGMPRQRPFFLAYCSDLAHVFEVHPRGFFGPSREPDTVLRRVHNQAVWTDLSAAWQDGIDQGLAEADLARRVEAIGRSHGAVPSRHLLHSLIGVDPDGCVTAFAMTGSLDGIAVQLSERWGIVDAVLLDNGGSVGWWSRSPGTDEAVLLVAGANYRPCGTVFLDFRLSEFLEPMAHPLFDTESP